MFNFYRDLLQEHISTHGVDYVKIIEYLSTLNLYNFRVDNTNVYIQPSPLAEFYSYDVLQFGVNIT